MYLRPSAASSPSQKIGGSHDQPGFEGRKGDSENFQDFLSGEDGAVQGFVQKIL
jgi:hypothetical protein